MNSLTQHKTPKSQDDLIQAVSLEVNEKQCSKCHFRAFALSQFQADSLIFPGSHILPRLTVESEWPVPLRRLRFKVNDHV